MPTCKKQEKKLGRVAIGNDDISHVVSAKKFHRLHNVSLYSVQPSVPRRYHVGVVTYVLLF